MVYAGSGSSSRGKVAGRHLQQLSASLLACLPACPPPRPTLHPSPSAPCTYTDTQQTAPSQHVCLLPCLPASLLQHDPATDHRLTVWCVELYEEVSHSSHLSSQQHGPASRQRNRQVGRHRNMVIAVSVKYVGLSDKSSKKLFGTVKIVIGPVKN